MAERIYFVDTAIPADKKKRKKEKTHVVFDGERLFKVSKLTELDGADEVYVDALFPAIYEEVIELIKKGIKIYLLRDTGLLEKLRIENGLEKSDEIDARLLRMIPKNRFKQLTLKEVTLLKLIEEYERYVKWRKIIRRWKQIHSLNSFEECIRELRSLCEHHARKIIREVKSDEKYGTIYRLACDAIGIKDSVDVAILIVRLPLNWKLRRLKGLLGLTPHKCKSYHHRLRANISKIAAIIYLNNKRLNKTTSKAYKDITGLPCLKAIYMLEIRILKALKRAWQQAQYMLAGEQ
jgi:hypothetical protein